MRVGSFPQSDLILCIVNSKQISLDNTSNIECHININSDILIIFHRKILYGKPCQNNFNASLRCSMNKNSENYFGMVYHANFSGGN